MSLNYLNNDSIEFESCSSSNSSSDSYISLPSLSESIASFIGDASNNFNVFHIRVNAQSIPAHFFDMLASFDHDNIHAILISESWLKPSLPSNFYDVPGFRVIRNDRTGSGGGGVAIYLRSHFPFNIIHLSPQPPSPLAGEHLLIEVVLHHSKLLLGVYYSPSLRINFFSSFEALLENYTTSYDHIVIIGDFNTCLLKNDSRSKAFESVVAANNLSLLPLNATHNLPNCVSSLLDLILISHPDLVYKHGQCAADAFSHHDLI